MDLKKKNLIGFVDSVFILTFLVFGSVTSSAKFWPKFSDRVYNSQAMENCKNEAP